MCLGIRKLEIYKAITDIPVYKILRIELDWKSKKLKWKASSPSYNQLWFYGTDSKIHKKEVKDVEFGINHHEGINVFYVDEGYHSYIDVYEAHVTDWKKQISDTVNMIDLYGGDIIYLVFSAVIPKDTEYIMRLDVKEIVSKKLQVKPEIIIFDPEYSITTMELTKALDDLKQTILERLN